MARVQEEYNSNSLLDFLWSSIQEYSNSLLDFRWSSIQEYSNAVIEPEFLPKEQTNLLFAISCLIGFTAAYAFIRKKYDLGVVCVLILVSSLIHWSDPKFGIKRDIDVSIVTLGFLYIFARAVILKIESPLFWISLISVVILFPVSWYFLDVGHVWLSTLIHCCLHICGNLSAVLLCAI